MSEVLTSTAIGSTWGRSGTDRQAHNAEDVNPTNPIAALGATSALVQQRRDDEHASDPLPESRGPRGKTRGIRARLHPHLAALRVA
ncbi:MAG: hypothetical protein ACRDZ4_20260 [Egibacteraceae bacterium]